MKLEGEIAEISLLERLVELGQESFTGAIRFENDGIIKIIYLKGGDVLSASTNDRADSVDEILMRAGKVSREHVKQALARRKETETLGDALLNLGFITRKELTWARRLQVVGVIRSILAWEVGSFTIVSDYLPKREEGTIFPLGQILVEVVVTDTDRPRFERLLDSGNAVFEKTSRFDEAFQRLGLNEDAQAIGTAIDGSRSAADVAVASGKESFNVYKLLHAMELLGLLRRISKGSPQVHADEFGFASIGAADADEMFSARDAAAIPGLADPMTGATAKYNFDTEPVDQAPDPPFASPDPARGNMFDSVEEAADLSIAPVPPPAISRPAPMEIGVKREEPQWGFDEAQIEAARKAAVPVRSLGSPVENTFTRRPVVTAPKKPKSSARSIVLVALLLLLGGGAYFGWKWWSGRQEAAPAPVVAKAADPVVVPPSTDSQADPGAAATSTIVELPTTLPGGTVTSATVAPRSTTSTAGTPPTATVPKVVPVVPPPVARPVPAPVTPAAASGSRGRYDEMARNFAANPRGAYTVQIALVCETPSIEQAIATGGDRFWFVPTSYRGRACYKLFWGRYDSEGAAQVGVAQIPASLRGAKPVVIRVPR